MVKRIWEVFPAVADAVRRKHEEVGLHGHHDFVHAFRVGEVAYQIGLHEYDERIAELAGAAGLCHNADRILQKKLNLGRCDPEPDLIQLLVVDWVRHVLDDAGTAAVVDAVLRHEDNNSSQDSNVLVALMDGDRVVNLDVDLFIRSGQYYHDIPAVDYQYLLSDPEATYRNPKSALRDAFYSLDWANPESPVCIRTRLGKKMAEGRVDVFRTFFDALKVQLAEEGTHPYPFAAVGDSE